MLSCFIKRVVYRVWQFKQTLFPVVDESLWREALTILPDAWQTEMEKLRDSEKAHTIRVYKAIRKENFPNPETKKELLLLTLVHDIGKGITRHTIFFKVAKVLFPISPRGHCIAGAKLLRRLGADKQLVLRVLKHHEKKVSDPLLKTFQQFDDRF
jgi:hypothetical protein